MPVSLRNDWPGWLAWWVRITQSMSGGVCTARGESTGLALLRHPEERRMHHVDGYTSKVVRSIDVGHLEPTPGPRAG